VDLVVAVRKLDRRQACLYVLDRWGGGAPAPVPAAGARKPAKWFGDFLSACEFLDRMIAREGGKSVAEWRYELPQKSGGWAPAIVVVRYDFPGGKKQMRPLHRTSTGWRIGLGPWGKARKCPLFGLQAIEEESKCRSQDTKTCSPAGEV
jgi:predicted RNA-binding Zn-ribbon protein involved in translation (DUF1610 family)